MKTNSENTVAYAIKQMLNLRPMTRKQIVKWLIEQKYRRQLSDAEWDTMYKNDYRGYYSDAFCQWKRNGTVEVKGGKYHVTDACNEEKVGLWTRTKVKQIEILEANVKNLRENYISNLQGSEFNGRTAKEWFELYENAEMAHMQMAEKYDKLADAIRLIKNI